MNVRISPATANDFADAQHTFDGGGDGHTCQCMWWMMPSAEFQKKSVDERAGMLRDELRDAVVSPALIAYVDDEPAGWVRVGPRTAQPRILRTKMVKAGTREPLEAGDVWAVSCFVVRREHRGQGVMAQLLDAAVAHARRHGARVVEGYPVDPTAKKTSSNELYHGVLSVFEEAGFAVIDRPRPDRAVVALPLDT